MCNPHILSLGPSDITLPTKGFGREGGVLA